MDALGDSIEQVLDFLSAGLGLRMIKRHRATEVALRRLEPLARFLQATEEMRGVTEEARETHDFVGFIFR